MTRRREAVIYSADVGYWEHVYVSLYSLLVNNRDIPFDVWILAEAYDDAFFSHVPFLNTVHPDVRVSWLPVDYLFPEDIPVDHLSVAAYYRILVDRFLPVDVRRVLHLDGDTVVTGSVRDLLDIELGDCVLAAARNHCHIGEEAHARRLGLPQPAYFNSGVLRIDLERWRQLEIGSKCLDYIRLHLRDEKLKFHDQDTLNSVLAARWKEINPRFNYCWWGTRAAEWQRYRASADQAGGPVVIHYAGLQPRPWEGGCPHPLEAEYWRYRMQTPYADRVKYLRSQLNAGRIKLQALSTWLRLGVRSKLRNLGDYAMHFRAR